jgi:hypothetical protein
MKDRPKLGRGLEDVSRYFLSGSAGKDDKEGEVVSPSAAIPGATGVCCPGSGLIQSCFLANLALETAKRRHPVLLWDFSSSPETRMGAMMQSILTPGESPGNISVRLYGLPGIKIIEEEGEVYPWTDGSVSEGSGPARGFDGLHHLVNAPGSLDFFLGCRGLSDYIFITETDEKSLLRAYAFIKVVCAKGDGSMVHVVFRDGSKDDGGSVLILNRFSRFIKTRLGCTINYLDSLIEDEQLAGSMKEGRPIVLSHARSDAGDNIIGICSRFFDAAPDQGMNGGWRRGCAS